MCGEWSSGDTFFSFGRGFRVELGWSFAGGRVVGGGLSVGSSVVGKRLRGWVVGFWGFCRRVL